MATTKVIDHLNYGEDTYYFGLAKESYIKEPRVRNASFDIVQETDDDKKYIQLAYDTDITARTAYTINIFVNRLGTRHDEDLMTSCIIDISPNGVATATKEHSSLKCLSNTNFPFEDLYIATEVHANAVHPSIAWRLLLDRSKDWADYASISIQILNCTTPTFRFSAADATSLSYTLIDQPYPQITVQTGTVQGVAQYTSFYLIQGIGQFALGEGLKPISNSTTFQPILLGHYNQTELTSGTNPLLVIGNGQNKNERANMCVLTENKLDMTNLPIFTTSYKTHQEEATTKIALEAPTILLSTPSSEAGESISLKARGGIVLDGFYVAAWASDRFYLDTPLTTVASLMNFEQSADRRYGIQIGSTDITDLDVLKNTPFIIGKLDSGGSPVNIAYINNNGNGFIQRQWHVRKKLLVGDQDDAQRDDVSALIYGRLKVSNSNNPIDNAYDKGNIDADGNIDAGIDINAGGNIKAAGTITSTMAMYANNGLTVKGGPLEVETTIEAYSKVEVGGSMKVGGSVTAQSYITSGGDYAEFIKPWADGNPEQEDRYCYMVTVKDGLLYKGNAGDHIFGITSKNPSVIGNHDKDLNQMTDKKWTCVGMRGIVPVYDDGSCIVGQFCKCGNGGIATYANEQSFETYFVIERLSPNMISVEVK